MPIYEYACLKCGKHIEVMQKTIDKPLARCGECGGKLEKQWSQTSVQFKGVGWYVTDYAAKKSGEEKSGGTESSSEKADSAATDGKTKEAADKTSSSNDVGSGAAATKTEKSSPAKPAANAKS